MELLPIGIVTFAVCLIVVMRPTTIGLKVLGVTLPLATAAAVNLPSVGGSSILCSQLVIIAIVAGIVLRSNLRRQALIMFQRDPAIVLFGLFAVYAAITAFMMPRFFEGSVPVYSFDRDVLGLAMLSPTTGNITQSLYLLSGVLVFGIVVYLVTRREGLTLAAQTLNLITISHLVFVGIDMLPGAGGLLEFVRTANYDLHLQQQVAGIRRAVGPYPEPSSLGAASVVLFAYNFVRFTQTRGIWFFLASGLTLACAILSFSSTAYAALGVLGGLWGLTIALNFFGRRGLGRDHVIGVVIAGAVALALTAFIFVEPLREFAIDMFDRLIGSKLASDSGIERSGWNKMAVQNAIDTYGLGVGLGGARTSSFATALLSNTGVFGTILFVAFMAVAILRRFPRLPGNETERPYIIRRRLFDAVRAATIAGLITSIISGTTVDQGAMFYTYAGIGAGLVATYRRRRSGRNRAMQSLRFAGKGALPVATIQWAREPGSRGAPARIPHNIFVRSQN